MVRWALTRTIFIVNPWARWIAYVPPYFYCELRMLFISNWQAHGYKTNGCPSSAFYRGVIAQKDIVSCENGQVTYRFQNSKTKCTEYRTVPGAKFLWMILRHVLPRGFRRARDYGFLHSNSKRLIQLIQYLFNLVVESVKPLCRKRPKPVCQHCGAEMEILKTRVIPKAILRTQSNRGL